MASAQNSPGGEAGSKNLTTVLVPVIGVALIVGLVVVIAATSESSTGTGKDKKKGGGEAKEPAEMFMKADAKTLMDGSLPGDDDPNLKPVGSQGLMIRDEKEGTGEPVRQGATVEIYYTGWLKNGSVFDSSAQRGEAITFSLDRLIPGWQQGIPGMKPGGVRKLVVPPDLGYGDRPQRSIPANSTLIFEVQLVSSK